MKKCLLIAPLVSHATAGRVAAIGSTTYGLYVADISTRPLRHRLDQYPFSLIKGYFDLNVRSNDPLYRDIVSYLAIIRDTLISRGILPESKKISDRIREVMNEVKPTVVVVYYGATAMHFARIIKRLFPKVPVIIIHNAIPVTLERKNKFQRLLRRSFINEFVDYNKWLNKLDYYIYASTEMSDFAQNRFNIPKNKVSILPDYLPRSLHVKTDSIINNIRNDSPSIIFLGAPERWGTAIDNLDSQFLDLAHEKINIYSGGISKEVIETGYGFKYPYFTDDEVFKGDLANYAHAFDAALITYGIEDKRERFRTTLPTRFITALTAGIPIVVRAGMFAAVEAYVQKHQIGFAYRDSHELKDRLTDNNKMSIYRAKAIEHLKVIGGECQSHEFEKIFEGLI
ncbi:MAG: hypothetical protein NT010_03005 [Proteobacteria bacterium]|nr:hypothetical protein [Pseudomonadota bacterium]